MAMATITTTFSTVTSVIPASFALGISEAENLELLGELTIAFTPTANQTAFPHTFNLFKALQAAQALSAPPGSPPQTSTVTI